MRRLILLFPVIFFAGLFGLSLFINNAFALKYEGQVKEAQAIKNIEEQERRAAEQKPIIRPTVEYKAESQGLKDPFRKPSSTQKSDEAQVEAKPLPNLVVQGVIWGGRFPQAIINNKVVKAGDNLEGVRVKDISREGITVLFEGSEYHISSPSTGPGPQKP
jgi:hypothetical protein